MLKQVVVGEGDGWIGGDEPERLDAALHRGFDNVGIGEPASGRDAIDRNVPDAGEVLAVLLVVELAISGKRGGKAALPRSHGIALSGDGEGGGAGAANIAGDERKIVDGGDCDSALGGVVDAHGPADKRRIGMAVEQRSFR